MWFVDPIDGDDTYSGNTPKRPFKSFTPIFSCIKPNEKIVVRAVGDASLGATFDPFAGGINEELDSRWDGVTIYGDIHGQYMPSLVDADVLDLIDPESSSYDPAAYLSAGGNYAPIIVQVSLGYGGISANGLVLENLMLIGAGSSWSCAIWSKPGCHIDINNCLIKGFSMGLRPDHTANDAVWLKDVIFLAGARTKDVYFDNVNVSSEVGLNLGVNAVDEDDNTSWEAGTLDLYSWFSANIRSASYTNQERDPAFCCYLPIKVVTDVHNGCRDFIGGYDDETLATQVSSVIERQSQRWVHAARPNVEYRWLNFGARFPNNPTLAKYTFTHLHDNPSGNQQVREFDLSIYENQIAIGPPLDETSPGKIVVREGHPVQINPWAVLDYKAYGIGLMAPLIGEHGIETRGFLCEIFSGFPVIRSRIFERYVYGIFIQPHDISMSLITLYPDKDNPPTLYRWGSYFEKYDTENKHHCQIDVCVVGKGTDLEDVAYFVDSSFVSPTNIVFAMLTATTAPNTRAFGVANCIFRQIANGTLTEALLFGCLFRIGLGESDIGDPDSHPGLRGDSMSFCLFDGFPAAADFVFDPSLYPHYEGLRLGDANFVSEDPLDLDFRLQRTSDAVFTGGAIFDNIFSHEVTDHDGYPRPFYAFYRCIGLYEYPFVITSFVAEPGLEEDTIRLRVGFSTEPPENLTLVIGRKTLAYPLIQYDESHLQIAVPHPFTINEDTNEIIYDDTDGIVPYGAYYYSLGLPVYPGVSQQELEFAFDPEEVFSGIAGSENPIDILPLLYYTYSTTHSDWSFAFSSDWNFEEWLYNYMPRQVRYDDANISDDSALNHPFKRFLSIFGKAFDLMASAVHRNNGTWDTANIDMPLLEEIGRLVGWGKNRAIEDLLQYRRELTVIMSLYQAVGSLSSLEQIFSLAQKSRGSYESDTLTGAYSLRYTYGRDLCFRTPNLLNFQSFPGSPTALIPTHPLRAAQVALEDTPDAVIHKTPNLTGGHPTPSSLKIWLEFPDYDGVDFQYPAMNKKIARYVRDLYRNRLSAFFVSVFVAYKTISDPSWTDLE